AVTTEMKTLAIILTAFVATGAYAQHEHHQPEQQQEQEKEQKQQLYTCPMHPEIVRKEPGQCPKCGMTLVPIKEKKKSSPTHATHQTHAEHATHNADGMAMAEHHHGDHAEHEMEMHSSLNLVDPMNREGSGTSWIPDSSPIYGYMKMFGDDMLMLHGAIFPRYTNVSSDRGDDRIDAPNWIMAMFSHAFTDKTQLGLRAMMSLDLLTEQGRGYPLLLQSGESWHDEPLHDRQHPHDLFDELSFSLSQKLANDLSGYIYFGYPGEPALGPPVFMHRPSAMDDPDAPIGHHWQDSTHITFGVATTGLQWKNVKIEGSIFTGREPDEDRYDFDRPRFDSYSGRISWNPTPDLALQVSHGYLKNPEALEPDLKQHRTTASLIYNKSLGPDANWATSLVWGQNNNTDEGKTQSMLIETNYQHERDTVYARWEYVEKSGHELVLDPIDLEKTFAVNAVSIGYVRDLSHGNQIDIGLGGQFTVDFWPGDLDRYYGGGPGYGFQVFLRMRPSRHDHGDQHSMK
ncbi:MAG TPA: heavy metal-binding domain-containing protein, partial [Chthoniobacterales bacterium]|nr:heavy metal-binding domain-containing protein [Chthoniobacterales bacterium]